MAKADRTGHQACVTKGES